MGPELLAVLRLPHVCGAGAAPRQFKEENEGARQTEHQGTGTVQSAEGRKVRAKTKPWTWVHREQIHARKFEKQCSTDSQPTQTVPKQGKAVTNSNKKLGKYTTE